MNWTYTDPLTIPKDEIRLLIGDTDEMYPMLYDEEIAYFLKANDNSVKAAAYQSAKTILHKLAYEPNYTIGPETVTGSPRLKTLQKLIEDLNPAKDLGAPMLASSVTPHPGTHDIFHIGMMDNIWDSGCTGVDEYGT